MLSGFVLAVILRIVLTNEFISGLFSPAQAFTVQELADLNIALTTGVLFVFCTAWYFSTMFFNKREDKAYARQVDMYVRRLGDSPIRVC